MDASEPSTNGTSISNLFRLSSALNDDRYARLARESLAAFESEVLQYPWLFGTFMPGVVASRLGVRGVVMTGSTLSQLHARARTWSNRARGSLGSLVVVEDSSAARPATHWLRQRNTLLADLQPGPAGSVRTWICEGKTCREDVDAVGDVARRVGELGVQEEAA